VVAGAATWRAAAEARTAEGRAHWRASEAAVETERRDIVGCDERRRGVAALRRPDGADDNSLDFDIWSATLARQEGCDWSTTADLFYYSLHI
jgi:hypothetical protein